jgi:anti-sigma factor RsiW
MTHLPPQSNSNDFDDIMLLSAYIDDELTDNERATLEHRLSAEPALRDELESLRTTATLLHDLPPVTPPRSFTLDPEQVQPRRSFLASPIFTGSMGLLRFGGVAAALVLAVAVTTLVYMGQAGDTTAELAEAPPVPESDEPLSGAAPEAGMMRQGTAAPPAMADAPAADAPPPEEQAATLMEEEAAAEAAPEAAEEEVAADEAAPEAADGEAAAALAPTPAATPAPLATAPAGTAPIDGALVATQEAAELAEEAETPLAEQESAASTTQDLEDEAAEQAAEPAPASAAPLPLLVVGALLTLALLGGGWFFWQRQRR